MKILLAEETRHDRRDELDVIAPDAQWVTIDGEGRPDGDPTGCEVIFWGAGMWTTRARLTPILEQWNSPSLRWVQGPAAGVDGKLWHDLIERGVRLTNGSGVWAEPIAQYVTGWVLAWSQGLEGQMRRSADHDWTQVAGDDLTARTMGIVGYGGIGKACGRIAKAIGMRVIAMRRSGGTDPHADEIVGPDQLHDLLEGSDYVVLCAPYTDATRDLIGAPEFAAMGPTTVFINVARGELVDEDAMADALRAGAIRGATTDVTRVEPLPADSPLWAVPNLVVTAHHSGEGPRAQERLDDLFVENLGRYMRGERLINEVTDTGITH